MVSKMTDKTDIDALRSEAANIIGLLTAAGHETFSLDKTADFFDDVFRLLEAECQQRAAAEITSESYKNILGVAIKELAALRGEQEPVAYLTRHMGCRSPDDCEEYLEVSDKDGVSGNGEAAIPVYTHPAKPVVVRPNLHPSHSYASVAVSSRDEQWCAAISDAGIVVKDGE